MKKIGLAPLLFMSDPRISIYGAALADIWQWTPFMILLLYAGRISINPKLYEVASVDGAGSWHTFWNVTLPGLKYFIVVGVILRCIDAFKLFDYIYVMTKGGPGSSSEVVTLYTFLTGFQWWRVGKAAALCWMLAIFVVILTNIFLWVTKGGKAKAA
jgi:multiple sugar transport system permease protein